MERGCSGYAPGLDLDTLGTDYGCCRDGVNIRSIYADAMLCFHNLGHRLGRLPLHPHSV